MLAYLVSKKVDIPVKGLVKFVDLYLQLRLFRVHFFQFTLDLLLKLAIFVFFSLSPCNNLCIAFYGNHS